jgi:hypothetical protein
MVMVPVNPAVSINNGATRTCGISLMESATAGFEARFWPKIDGAKPNITKVAEIIRVVGEKGSIFHAYPQQGV